MNIFETLPNICKRLNECGVKYILIGGCAIIIHGYERLTREIDLIVETADENITKLRIALTSFLTVDEVKDLNGEMVKNTKLSE